MIRQVLVIIVTYNPMKWVDRCFQSLQTSTVPVDALVVDNGSNDGGQAYIREHFPNVTLIQSSENLGFGKANNIGLQFALEKGYEYVYLLNQDAWIFPDTISSLISVNKSNPQYGVLSPFQLEANMQHLDRKFIENVLANHQNTEPYFSEDLYFNRVSDVYEVSFVMAAHWLISCSCLQKVGGFSPTFTHYGEDGNYLHRANYFGYKVGIVPKAKAVHDRENRVETYEHRLYIEFVCVLKNLSNPLAKPEKSIYGYLKQYLKRAYYWRSKSHWNYALKLIKMRDVIRTSYAMSLKDHAFLK